MPRFEFNWANQPLSTDGYKLIRTEVITARDVLEAVIKLLPKGEHEFVDVEEVQRIKHEVYIASRKAKREEQLKRNFDEKLLNGSASASTNATQEPQFEEVDCVFEEENSSDSPPDQLVDLSGSLSKEEFDSFDYEDDEGIEEMESESEDGEYQNPNNEVITIVNCYRKMNVNEWGSYDKVETIKIKRRNLVVDYFLSDNE